MERDQQPTDNSLHFRFHCSTSSKILHLRNCVLHSLNFKTWWRNIFHSKLHYLSIFTTLHTILTTALCYALCMLMKLKHQTQPYKIIFAKNKKFVSDVRRGDKFLLNEFFIAPSQRETFSGIGKWNVYPNMQYTHRTISTEYRRQNFYCFTIIDLYIDLMLFQEVDVDDEFKRCSYGDYFKLGSFTYFLLY